MKLIPRGQLVIDEMAAVYPLVRQPGISVVDYLVNFSAGNLQNLTDLVVDGLAGGGYAQPLFVPHNQKTATVSGGTSIDANTQLKTGLPNLVWDTITLGGASAKLIAYRDHDHGFQDLDAVWDANTPPTTMTVDAQTALVQPAGGGGNGNVTTQGVVARLTRTHFLNYPTTDKSYWEFRWTANFRLYSILCDSNAPPRLRVSDDDGVTWVVANPEIKGGVSQARLVGAARPGHQGGEVHIEVRLLNSSMRVTIGANTSPYRIPVASPRPSRTPVLTSIAGSLDAATYKVGYTIVNAAGEETLLSPTGSLSAAAGSGVRVTGIPLPSGAAKLRYYISTPTGLRLAAERTDGNTFDITSLPAGAAAQPPTANQVQPVITHVRVRAGRFSHFGWSVHLAKWVTTCSLRSNPLATGQAIDASTPPRYAIHGASEFVERASGVAYNPSFPAGSSITVTRVGAATDANQVYDLAIANPQATLNGAPATYQGTAYADHTAFVTRVTTKVDEKVDAARTSVARNIVPKQVSFSAQFIPGALTVRRSLNVVLDNFHAQWRGQAGNVAIRLALGMTQPSIALANCFTGVADTYTFDRPGGGQATIGFDCMELMDLFDTPIWDAPDMDGWNHYYAVAWLAKKVGISPSRFAFASLVPPDPSTYMAGDPNPFFLPLGEGMRPWTPRDRSQPARNLLRMVQAGTGFLCYVDGDGMLQYHQWIPPSAGSVVKTFTEQETGLGGADIAQLGPTTIRTSTRELRNVNVLIGVDSYDPTWRITATKREDTRSIEVPAGERPPDNFLGFRRPAAWVSSMFASAEYAERCADRFHDIQRLPEYSGNTEVWMQPQLDVMDVIKLADTKSGIESVPLYVMGLRHFWTCMGRHRFRTYIQARYLIG
jgi:hypothetical protein